jgi:capsular exopolysaccharide synthesis family protein
MDLAAHFRIILRAWKKILIVAVLVAVLVFLYTNRSARVYRSTALLAVTPSDTGAGQSNAQQANYLAQSYALLVDTPRVAAAAAKSSGLDLTVDETENRTSAAAVGSLGYLEVYATGPSPEAARRLANASADALIAEVRRSEATALSEDIAPLQEQRARLQAQLDTLPVGSPEAASVQANIDAINQVEAERRAKPSNRVNVSAAARASRTPIAPHPARSAVIAFIIAAILAGEAIVVSRAIGDRIGRSGDTDADIARITGLPIIGHIPKGEGFETVEAFRVLRTNLIVLEAAGRPRTVAVVAATQDAGKTFVSVNLAQSASALDDKVVLIDADLRRPAVHDRLNVPRAPGLTSVLQGADLSESLRRVHDSPFLRVLASGPPVEDPSAVLGARSFRTVLDALRAVRLVVVDTPPAALFSDALAVASQCDATVLVVDLNNTRTVQVRQTLDQLERAGANTVGIVVNRTAATNRSSYYEG